MQNVCKAHIFSFNQFRGGNCEWGEEIFIPLGHYGLRLNLLRFPEHVCRQTPTQCVAIEGQLNHSVIERTANVI